MSRISEQDWQEISACLERLYACRSLADFPLLACVELPKVIRADNTTFNYIAPSIGRVHCAWAPDLGRFEERVRLTAEFLPCHPVANHHLSTGDGSARLISDFCNAREFHCLPIYDALYREMGYEDQLAFQLFPLGGEMIALAFARDRRTFTERDRMVANLIRPHVAQAYRNAEAFSRLTANGSLPAWTREILRVTTIVLDPEQRPRHYAPEAREWLDRFFSASRGTAVRLPPALENWLRRHAPDRSHVFVRERGGERLSMRLYPASRDVDALLVLELETPVGATSPLRRSGLTAREIDVLQHVEHGRTNLEIAAKLGISAQTVRAHLEHIYRKLGVPNRTAAVTRMRRLGTV